MPTYTPSGHPSVRFDPDSSLVEAGASRFQLRLLDGFDLEEHGRVLRIPHSARRLVAFLGIRGRSCRAEIAGTLWPDAPETRAQASLRTVLWRLNRLTGDPVVGGSEMLALANTVDADVQRFVDTARRTMTDGDDSTTPILSVGGELLPGWYDDWVLFERERLRQLRMHALEAAARQLTTAGRHAEAIEAALAAVRLEPLREGATRVLIVAHLAEHNSIEAVRCFESYRDNLAAELGVRPTLELERLVRSGLHR